MFWFGEVLTRTLDEYRNHRFQLTSFRLQDGRSRPGRPMIELLLVTIREHPARR